MIARCLLAAALLIAAPLSSADSGVELQPGQPLAVTLPAEGFSNAVYIDVPAGAERLTVQFDADNLAQDVDLLLRYDSPFPNTTFDGAPVEIDWLMEHAHFRSISSRGDESVVITGASRQPLRAGRLHLSLINFSASPAPATLSATLGAADDFVPLELVFDDSSGGCDVSGWNDPAARAPLRLNAGTTLGQQRRNALGEAARLIAQELRPNAAIRMQMCWEGEKLEFDNCAGTLAQAGPRYVAIDNPGSSRATPLDSRYVMQASAVAVHQSGTARCRFNGGDCRSYPADLRATFNLKVDTQDNPACAFDYGLTPVSPSQGLSIVAVAMHEIAHGLGFIGFLNLDSESESYGDQFAPFGLPFHDGYGRHATGYLLGDPEPERLLQVSNERRLSILTSSSGLRFDGTAGVSSGDNQFASFAAPDNSLRLHAPFTLAAGSTYSHLSHSHSFGSSLMRASGVSQQRTLGLGRDVMADVGWSNAPKSAPAATPVLGSQYFDPSRNGHGFELRRIDGLGFDDLYFLLFYSYDDDGFPEWFSAAGTVVDGVFMPARDAATGDSLLRNLYREGQQPSTVADTSPDHHGEVRIDFVQSARHPACLDSTPGRALDGALGILSWEVNGIRRQWCVQPLLDGRAGVEVDFSNQWYNPADGGWGMSILSYPGEGGDGLGLLLYFPDSEGRGRWALVQTNTYVPGENYPVLMPRGFCRTCPAQEAQEFEEIGTLSVSLFAPGEGASRVSIDVTYPGPQGGRFVRTDAPIVPVGTPGYRLP